MNLSTESFIKQAQELDQNYHWTQASGVYLQASNQATETADKFLYQAFSNQMLVNAGHTETALKNLQNLEAQSRTAPLPPEISASIKYHLGWAYYDHGQYPEARSTLNQALQDSPQTFELPIQHHLARTDLDEGIISSDPKQITSSYQQLSNHNQQLGDQLAHDLRLMARPQQCLFLLNRDPESQQQANQLYSQATQLFTEQNQPYYPHMLPAEQQLLLETKKPQVILDLQNFLRPQREKIYQNLVNLNSNQRQQYINQLIKTFKQTFS